MNSAPHDRSSSPDSELDAMFMARALELARRGQGFVEPNPLVGCVVVQGGEVVGEGWHQKFGGAHAEIEALRIASSRAQGATAFVTLEPCCHYGKTPPCTNALISAGIARVVCAVRDPFESVSGRGIAQLEAAGMAVDLGPGAAEARRLNAPYLKLVTAGRPWVIAKWAMSLDGKIATRTGESRWISGDTSRQIAHALRGRMDGIIVGHGTVQHDDPLLTARPPGPRIAHRIVVDSLASLPLKSQLVQTATKTPVLVAVGSAAPQEHIDRLTAAGCDVMLCQDADAASRRVSIPKLLDELGRRRLTNILVEGGGQLLGSFFDAGAIDEIHVFVAPKIIGGQEAHSPIAGRGLEKICSAVDINHLEVEHSGDDLHLHGFLN